VINSVLDDGGAVTLLDLADARGPAPHFADDVESIAGHDIGVVRLRRRAGGTTDWQLEPLPIVADVSTFGYSFSISPQAPVVSGKREAAQPTDAVACSLIASLEDIEPRLLPTAVVECTARALSRCAGCDGRGACAIEYRHFTVLGLM
jgi:hypothetical protein